MSVPTAPFEVESTKAIIQQHIDNGDIKQSDIDVLKRTYSWMFTASALGSVGFALPTYFYLRRARPIRPIGVRLMASGGMGMIGSFLGFALGGFAAALEVNRQMDNPKEKMKIFQQIAQEARQSTIQQIQNRSSPTTTGGPGRTLPTSSSTPRREEEGVSMSTSTWAGEAALDRQEMERERARERGKSASLSSSQASSSSSSSSSSPSAYSPREDGLNAWDKLRKEAFPSSSDAGSDVDSRAPRPRAADGIQSIPVGLEARREYGASRAGATGVAGTGAGTSAGAGAEGGGDKERSREQAEFDALLEKERKGGDGDKWA